MNKYTRGSEREYREQQNPSTSRPVATVAVENRENDSVLLLLLSLRTRQRGGVRSTGMIK